MTTWTPSPEFHRALTLVNDLAEEAPRAGSSLAPAFKWRMIQLISEAMENSYRLGHAMANAEAEDLAKKYADKSTDGVPAVTYTNGVAGVSQGKAMGTPEVADMWGNGTASNAPETHTLTLKEVPASAYVPPAGETPFDMPKKRGRGRPKGSTKKKRLKAQAEATQ